MTGSNISHLRKSFPILFGSRWRARKLDETLASIDTDMLCAEYTALSRAAPRRAISGKNYFVGHTGVASSAGKSNRLEEHCAIAMANLGRRWPRSGGGWFRLLDYQVPLKARQADARIGKIDLLGVTDRGRLMVVELKVVNHSGGRSDAPPAALMEGLRYAAIIEANLEAIASEAEHCFGVKIAMTPPIIQLLAPKAWWQSWLELPAAGDWGSAFANLVEAVKTQTGVTTECTAFDDVEITYGLDGRAPRLDHLPALYSVEPGQRPPIGDALPPLPPNGEGGSAYLDTVYRALWAWADQHHEGELDGGRQQGRPPVLKPEFTAKNVLVPPDGSRADEIRAAIGSAQRHRHFASLRSSQALAQSVFAALSAFERLEVLQNVTAECGRPAFFQAHKGWTVALEHEVDTLGEPRPTSIDVLLNGPDQRVAIECKFTEPDFGTCSRPRLRPGDPTYSRQRCDGNYRVQAGRSDRCALTAIGVRYWDHLPQLFAWSTDRDHEPCPFGAVYQLARNALAAVVTPDGEVDLARGHALVLYDARNPAFQVGGEADRQWEATIAACLVPGLLRRLSWQRLLTAIAKDSDLTWLVDSLQQKYALLP